MAFSQKTTLNIGSKLYDFSTPQVMGIINLTSDSFYADSRVSSERQLLNTAEKMYNEGALILDIGAMSSRPGAVDLGEEMELIKLIPAIKSLKKAFPNGLISIDTYRAKVARQCIDAGAHIINDISGGNGDPQMISTIADLQVPYILMHMKGMPENMQDDPKYDNVVTEVYAYLQQKLNLFIEAGAKDIILDLGFGFGKTIDHNYELLENLTHFSNIGHPILVGISRKSMIYKPLGISPAEALPATSALHRLALSQGANLLRVHDVKEAIDAIKAFEESKEAKAV